MLPGTALASCSLCSTITAETLFSAVPAGGGSSGACPQGTLRRGGRSAEGDPAPGGSLRRGLAGPAAAPSAASAPGERAGNALREAQGGQRCGRRRLPRHRQSRRTAGGAPRGSRRRLSPPCRAAAGLGPPALEPASERSCGDKEHGEQRTRPLRIAPAAATRPRPQPSPTARASAASQRRTATGTEKSARFGLLPRLRGRLKDN